MELWLILVTVLLSITILVICIWCYCCCNYILNTDAKRHFNEIITHIENESKQIFDTKYVKHGPVTCTLKIVESSIKTDIGDTPRLDGGIMLMNYYNRYIDILNTSLDIPHELKNIILDYLDDYIIESSLLINRHGYIDRAFIPGYIYNATTYIHIGMNPSVWLKYKYNSTESNNRMDIICNTHNKDKYIINHSNIEDRILGYDTIGYIIFNVINRSDINIKIDIQTI